MTSLSRLALALMFTLALLLGGGISRAETVSSLSGALIETAAVETLLVQQMSVHQVPGLSFALINDGKLVMAAEYGVVNRDQDQRVTPNTLFETASISKSVFAVLTLQLVDQGLLSLDEPLQTYLPLSELQDDPRRAAITARMVLSHTSGLPNWRFHNEDGRLDLKFAPGTDFLYSGEGYEYLARALATLRHTDFAGLNQMFQEQLAQSLGMHRATFQLDAEAEATKAFAHEEGSANNDKSIGFDRYFGAAYGLHSNARDFSAFLLALLDERGLSRRGFAELYRAQSRIPDDDSLRTENGFDRWGLGLMMADTPYGVTYAHGGMNPGFQGYFMLNRERRFAFVYFGNSDTAINMLPAVERLLIGGEMR